MLCRYVVASDIRRQSSSRYLRYAKMSRWRRWTMWDGTTLAHAVFLPTNGSYTLVVQRRQRKHVRVCRLALASHSSCSCFHTPFHGRPHSILFVHFVCYSQYVIVHRTLRCATNRRGPAPHPQRHRHQHVWSPQIVALIIFNTHPMPFMCVPASRDHLPSFRLT